MTNPSVPSTMSQLEMAVRSFEAQFDHIDHTTFYAEDVVELFSGGVRGDEGRTPAYYATEALAVRAWFDAAMAYKARKPCHKLVWRIKPSLDYYDLKFVRAGGPADGDHEAWERTCDDGEPIRLYRVRSRLAIRSFVRSEAEANPRRDAFEKLCADVLNSGVPVQPRTPETHEITAAQMPSQSHIDYSAITKDIVGGG